MTHCGREKLRLAGLRASRQRIALADILFAEGDRHVSAESPHAEALEADVSVSVATIYNTLNKFVEAGLLREIAIDSSKRFFDTKMSNHYHIYFEDEERLVDIAPGVLEIRNMPDAPEGTEVIGADILIRVRTSSS